MNTEIKTDSESIETTVGARVQTGEGVEKNEPRTADKKMSHQEYLQSDNNGTKVEKKNADQGEGHA